MCFIFNHQYGFVDERGIQLCTKCGKGRTVEFAELPNPLTVCDRDGCKWVDKAEYVVRVDYSDQDMILQTCTVCGDLRTYNKTEGCWV